MYLPRLVNRFISKARKKRSVTVHELCLNGNQRHFGQSFILTAMIWHHTLKTFTVLSRVVSPGEAGVKYRIFDGRPLPFGFLAVKLSSDD